MTAEALIERWRIGLRSHGFDLVQPFAADAYNASPMAQGQEFRLPTLGRERPLALVVGHSQALWEVFPQVVQRDPSLVGSEHPLDDYAMAVVRTLACTSDTLSVALFSHQVEPVVPIQRIAAVAGLAELSPCHLSVHPTLGPWLGLRAVIVFDVACPPSWQPPPARHCATCAKPCLGALEHANAGDPSRKEAWLDWLALRDSCPVGRTARYSEAQIRYHYTKDRRWLSEAPLNSLEIE